MQTDEWSVAFTEADNTCIVMYRQTIAVTFDEAGISLSESHYISD